MGACPCRKSARARLCHLCACSLRLQTPEPIDPSMMTAMHDTFPMPLAHLLYTQGFGTRRICAGLIQQGLVQINGQTVTDAQQEVDAYDGMPFIVQNQPWQYYAQAYLMLHKPAGTECSQKPSAWPSVYTLLPAPLRQRPQKGAVQGVQAIGRLDQDTTGLLILTDDGQLIHRMASPKHHVPKVYQVQCLHPVTSQQVNDLQGDIRLDNDPRPVRAVSCMQTGSHALELTLTEGRYHQVKRMLAAVGNQVVQLHRSRIGALALPPDLPAGGWRWLLPHELTLLQEKALPTA